mmetsp:Transcript_48003/g.126653  ORF Transcript_48003/g.126653 Transcript_48003/m.126653 type:complete len:88 (-) Transcript_48003:1161-1424(-)
MWLVIQSAGDEIFEAVDSVKSILNRVRLDIKRGCQGFMHSVGDVRVSPIHGQVHAVACSCMLSVRTCAQWPVQDRSAELQGSSAAFM